MVARRSFLLSLCQAMQEPAGVIPCRGELCWRWTTEDAGRPPQQPGCPGRSDGWGTPAIEPKWRRRLIRAAHGNFTRRASSEAARNGWRGPQGRQPKENPPSLFSVEKTKWATAIAPRSKRPHIGSLAYRVPTFAIQSKPIIQACPNTRRLIQKRTLYIKREKF